MTEPHETSSFSNELFQKVVKSSSCYAALSPRPFLSPWLYQDTDRRWKRWPFACLPYRWITKPKMVLWGSASLPQQASSSNLDTMVSPIVYLKKQEQEENYKVMQPQKYQGYTLVIYHFSITQKVDINVKKRKKKKRSWKSGHQLEEVQKPLLFTSTATSKYLIAHWQRWHCRQHIWIPVVAQCETHFRRF